MELEALKLNEIVGIEEEELLDMIREFNIGIMRNSSFVDLAKEIGVWKNTEMIKAVLFGINLHEKSEQHRNKMIDKSLDFDLVESGRQLKLIEELFEKLQKLEKYGGKQ